MWRIINITGQRGQALILSLLLMSTAIMVVLISYNSSQLNLHTSKLQNTADNTVFTVASIAARDMNFKAYTNRAAVANQVAVAQMVGLSSWFNMTDKFAENACRYLCWVPYLGQVLNGIEQAVGAVNSVAQPIFEAMIYAENVVLIALTNAQSIMHYAALVSTVDTAKEVVKANDEQAELNWMQNALLARDVSDAWFRFQKQHSRNSGRYGVRSLNRANNQFQEHIGVILDSRDPFSIKRSYKLKFPWSFTIPFWRRWKTQKTGGSELITNRGQAETWTSMDTISFHLSKFKCSWSGCRWRSYRETPLGWGGTRTDTRASIASIGNRNYWGKSRRTNKKAARYAGYQQETRGNYSGVQPFYGLSQRDYKSNQTRNFSIVVSKRQSNVRTTSSISAGHKNTDPAQGEEMAGDRVSSLASANAFYSRPADLLSSSSWKRPDNKYEYGNLYNPFWQPRLTQSSTSERSFVLAITRAL